MVKHTESDGRITIIKLLHHITKSRICSSSICQTMVMTVIWPRLASGNKAVTQLKTQGTSIVAQPNDFIATLSTFSNPSGAFLLSSANRHQSEQKDSFHFVWPHCKINHMCKAEKCDHTRQPSCSVGANRKIQPQRTLLDPKRAALRQVCSQILQNQTDLP